MRDCTLRCTKKASTSFDVGEIYKVRDNVLETKDIPIVMGEYNTIEEINRVFSSQFELVNDYDSLTLSEIKSKYGSICYIEIVKVVSKYKAIIPKSEIIETYKSILDIAKYAYSVLNGEVFNEDGDFLFEVNKRTYMDCKEYVLKEEIDKHESANRR